MNSKDLPTSKNSRSIKIEDVEVIIPESNQSDIIKKQFTEEQTTLLISEGAKLINRVMDVVHLREQTDASLRTMDKKIELVQKTTRAEIEKMVAETDNWERRFAMVSKVLNDMTITLTQNKDLHPDVAKSLIDTVKSMVDKLSIK
jgi:hypothetical protein